MIDAERAALTLVHRHIENRFGAALFALPTEVAVRRLAEQAMAGDGPPLVDVLCALVEHAATWLLHTYSYEPGDDDYRCALDKLTAALTRGSR